MICRSSCLTSCLLCLPLVFPTQHGLRAAPHFPLGVPGCTAYPIRDTPRACHRCYVCCYVPICSETDSQLRCSVQSSMNNECSSVHSEYCSLCRCNRSNCENGDKRVANLLVLELHTLIIQQCIQNSATTRYLQPCIATLHNTAPYYQKTTSDNKDAVSVKVFSHQCPAYLVSLWYAVAVLAKALAHTCTSCTYADAVVACIAGGGSAPFSGCTVE